MKSKLPVGKFENESILLEKENALSYISSSFINNAGIIKNLFSNHDKENLINIYENQSKIPVGIDGIVNNFHEGDLICSYRATLFSKSLAKQIFNRIQEYLPKIKGLEACGVNESFRFIDYVKEGILVPHYDEGYTNKDNETSYITMVIYLMQGNDGYTEFVEEYRKNDLSDWNTMANDKSIIEVAYTQSGDALIFPHKTLHQGSKTKERKIIMRTDIMYKEKE